MDKVEKFKQALNEFNLWKGAAVLLRDTQTNKFVIKKYYGEIDQQEIMELEQQGFVVAESKENQHKYNGDMYIM